MGHTVVSRVRQVHPDLFILHIGDAVASAIKKHQWKKVNFHIKIFSYFSFQIGLLGTRYSMTLTSPIVERLIQHGLDVVFPPVEKTERIHRVLFDELIVNVCTPESKQFFLETIQQMHDRHQIEAIVLECTGKIN